jgi:TPR repeat protein
MLKKTYLTCLILTSCSTAIMLSSCSTLNKIKSHFSSNNNHNNNAAISKENKDDMKVFSTPQTSHHDTPSSKVNTSEGVALSKEDHIKLKQVEKKAEDNDPEAQWKLGMIYFKGLADVTENDDEAFHWMSKSAAQNYAPAEYMLGFFYEHGAGVKKDMKLAKQYYEKAKENGFKVSENKELQF